MNDQIITPPVSVIAVPARYGTRGYGAKADGDWILLPYNKSIENTFADVPEKKTMIMLRRRFDSLETIG